MDKLDAILISNILNLSMVKKKCLINISFLMFSIVKLFLQSNL